MVSETPSNHHGIKLRGKTAENHETADCKQESPDKQMTIKKLVDSQTNLSIRCENILNQVNEGLISTESKLTNVVV